MKRLLATVYRYRLPIGIPAVAVLVTSSFFDTPEGPSTLRVAWTAIIAIALLAALVGLIALWRVPRTLVSGPALDVLSPVHGRWEVLNSPATKVPSHGVRAYGQAYAVDLVASPINSPRPTFGGPLMRANSEYPAFGAPVYSMVSGTVVRASDWRRDHRARSNWVALVYLIAEGMIREIGGPGFIVGNHVVVQSGDRVFATIAHLQQGSVTVNVGDVVSAGQLIGRCGNSGNSSEPHVHAQLADRVSLWTAQGIAMAFSDIRVEESPNEPASMPADGQHLLR